MAKNPFTPFRSMRCDETTRTNHVTFCGRVDDRLKRAKSGADFARPNPVHRTGGPAKTSLAIYNRIVIYLLIYLCQAKYADTLRERRINVSDKCRNLT